MSYDVCIVGHVTKDIVETAEARKEHPGGTAYYTAIALKRLGMSVAVTTRLHRRDRFLLSELEDEQIAVFCSDSDGTTQFKNVYSEDTQTRVQWVKDIAAPFTVSDVARVDAEIFHLGPLTPSDIPVDVIRLTAAKATTSLDVQGFIRKVGNRRRGWAPVEPAPWKNKTAALAGVDILKADWEEAQVLSTKRDRIEIALELSGLGPSEVVITDGPHPSFVYAEGRGHWIPAYPPRNPERIDPTGCGDTYMAGYLFQRIKRVSPDEAGRFAAMAAALKLERSGPFKGEVKDIRAFGEECQSRSQGSC